MRNEHDAYHALANQKRKPRYTQKPKQNDSKFWLMLCIAVVGMFGYFYYRVFAALGSIAPYL